MKESSSRPSSKSTVPDDSTTLPLNKQSDIPEPDSKKTLPNPRFTSATTLKQDNPSLSTPLGKSTIPNDATNLSNAISAMPGLAIPENPSAIQALSAQNEPLRKLSSTKVGDMIRKFQQDETPNPDAQSLPSTSGASAYPVVSPLSAPSSRKVSGTADHSSFDVPSGELPKQEHTAEALTPDRDEFVTATQADSNKHAPSSDKTTTPETHFNPVDDKSVDSKSENKPQEANPVENVAKAVEVEDISSTPVVGLESVGPKGSDTIGNSTDLAKEPANPILSHNSDYTDSPLVSQPQTTQNAPPVLPEGLKKHLENDESVDSFKSFPDSPEIATGKDVNTPTTHLDLEAPSATKVESQGADDAIDTLPVPVVDNTEVAKGSSPTTGLDNNQSKKDNTKSPVEDSQKDILADKPNAISTNPGSSTHPIPKAVVSTQSDNTVDVFEPVGKQEVLDAVKVPSSIDDIVEAEILPTAHQDLTNTYPASITVDPVEEKTKLGPVSTFPGDKALEKKFSTSPTPIEQAAVPEPSAKLDADSIEPVKAKAVESLEPAREPLDEEPVPIESLKQTPKEENKFEPKDKPTVQDHILEDEEPVEKQTVDSKPLSAGVLPVVYPVETKDLDAPLAKNTKSVLPEPVNVGKTDVSQAKLPVEKDEVAEPLSVSEVAPTPKPVAETPLNIVGPVDDAIGAPAVRELNDAFEEEKTEEPVVGTGVAEPKVLDPIESSTAETTGPTAVPTSFDDEPVLGTKQVEPVAEPELEDAVPEKLSEPVFDEAKKNSTPLAAEPVGEDVEPVAQPTLGKKPVASELIPQAEEASIAPAAQTKDVEPLAPVERDIKPLEEKPYAAEPIAKDIKPIAPVDYVNPAAQTKDVAPIVPVESDAKPTLDEKPVATDPTAESKDTTPSLFQAKDNEPIIPADDVIAPAVQAKNIEPISPVEKETTPALDKKPLATESVVETNVVEPISPVEEDIKPTLEEKPVTIEPVSQADDIIPSVAQAKNVEPTAQVERTPIAQTNDFEPVVPAERDIEPTLEKDPVVAEPIVPVRNDIKPALEEKPLATEPLAQTKVVEPLAPVEKDILLALEEKPVAEPIAPVKDDIVQPTLEEKPIAVEPISQVEETPIAPVSQTKDIEPLAPVEKDIQPTLEEKPVVAESIAKVDDVVLPAVQTKNIEPADALEPNAIQPTLEEKPVPSEPVAQTNTEPISQVDVVPPVAQTKYVEQVAEPNSTPLDIADEEAGPVSKEEPFVLERQKFAQKAEPVQETAKPRDLDNTLPPSQSQADAEPGFVSVPNSAELSGYNTSPESSAPVTQSADSPLTDAGTVGSPDAQTKPISTEPFEFVEPNQSSAQPTEPALEPKPVQTYKPAGPTSGPEFNFGEPAGSQAPSAALPAAAAAAATVTTAAAGVGVARSGSQSQSQKQVDGVVRAAENVADATGATSVNGDVGSVHKKMMPSETNKSSATAPSHKSKKSRFSLKKAIKHFFKSKQFI